MNFGNVDYEVNDFTNDVIEASKHIPVLVDFWAEWCGPCRMLGPVLEKMAAYNNGEWKLVKVDTDANQEIAVEFGIRSIPAVKLFINGAVVGEFVGALPEERIKTWLKKYIPQKGNEKLNEAIKLFERGESNNAVKMLESLIEKGGSPDAEIMLAKFLFFKDPKRAMEILKAMNPSKEQLDLHEALLNLGEVMSKNADTLPESDVKDSYIKAIEEIKSQNFDSALERFIEIIRNDRYYDDDGSRKACIAIFKYLGEEHPTTLKYRRDFGSALYV